MVFAQEEGVQEEDGASMGSLAQGIEDTGLTVTADNAFWESNDVARAEGNVHIEVGGTEIYSEKAQYHHSTGDIFADGSVSVYRAGQIFRGESIVYNVRTEELKSTSLRSGMAPLFYTTDEMSTDAEALDKISMMNAEFTTHDAATPNYKIRAKKMTIYPNGRDRRVVFRKATIYAGNVPVFYLPYLSQPLDEELGYHFLPGFRDNWGGFLLNRYGIMIGDHTIATFRFDYRSKRGVAGGIDLKSIRFEDNPNFGNFKFYIANDTDTTISNSGRIREDVDIDSTRYRVNLQHRIYLPGPEESTLYLDIDINKISDGFFYEDFFEEEFRIDPQPDNLLNLQKIFPRGQVSLLTRFDVNDFYRNDTRLPEIAVDFTTQPIFDTGLFYTGETSFGIYDEELGDLEREQFLTDIGKGSRRLEDPAGTLLKDPDFSVTETESMIEELSRQLGQTTGYNRFDTYHQINAPQEFFGWLNFNPRVGFRYTSYNDIDTDEGVEVTGVTTTITGSETGDDGSVSDVTETTVGTAPADRSGLSNSLDRTTFHAGFDLSFKLSRDMPNVALPRLGVDGLRHIVQPYVNYSYVSTDESLDDRIRRIDRFVPTTKLRPIDLHQSTFVDDIVSWNIVRPGVSQRWQTVRDGRAYNWLETNTYFDYYIDDPEFERDFSNIHNETRWRPLPWLALDVDSQIPVFNSGDEFDFTEINTRLTFQPTKNFEFSIGNRLLQDHPFFEDSNLLELTTYTKLTETLGVSTFHRYEADDSTLEYQQYSLHKDLTSWSMGIGATIRDHREGDTDFGIVFLMTLKDFPQLSVPFELQPGGTGN
ncbi:MAG: hypothetical protein AAGJ79_00145 [Verrucomicrobiota bacterium]